MTKNKVCLNARKMDIIKVNFSLQKRKKNVRRKNLEPIPLRAPNGRRSKEKKFDLERAQNIHERK